MRVPSATRFGVPAEAANTCWGWWGGQLLAPWGDAELPRLEAAVVGKHLADDLGVWSNYSLLVKTFAFAQQHGLLEQHLGVDEFASIPWDHFEAKDPRFVADVIRRIAHAEGELGQTLGGRTADWVRDWSFPDAYFQSFRIGYFKDGHPRHHSVTSGGQVGLLVNTQYNRDAQCHSHSSFLRCGLPHEVIREIAGEVFGSPEAVDERDALTRTNPAKARFAKWAVLRKELHDSVALCNWMFPFLVSPRKDRDYRGDSGLEAKLFSAVTGIETSEQELDQAAERIFNLHRALTFRGLGEPDLRAHHDVLPPWVFHDDQDRAPYTPGSRAMEREDMDLALTQFYEACGWDPQTGAPTRKTLRGLGLGDVADGLAQAKLI